VDIDSTQWRQWPPSGSASVRTAEAPAPQDAYEVPEISTEALAGQAASCLRDWDMFDHDKVAALVADVDSGVITPENIWRHHDAHPFVLLMLIIDKYGNEAVEWMPDTLKTTLERDGIALSNGSFTKLLAARILLASPSPWRQWEVFHWVSRALVGIAPNFTYLEEPELAHLFVCADVMKLADPKRKTGIEIDKYVAAALKHQGIHYAPAPLDFAQREIEQPQIQCKKCDAVHRDDNDVKCVACGSANLTKLPYAFAESRDAARKLWDERKSAPIEKAVAGLPNTGVGNAVYTLLVNWDYARRVRAQMLQQLRMIGSRR
jgi:hypothetical protein